MEGEQDNVGLAPCGEETESEDECDADTNRLDMMTLEEHDASGEENSEPEGGLVMESEDINVLSLVELMALWRDHWKQSQRQFCLQMNINTSVFSQWLAGKVASPSSARAVRVFLHEKFSRSGEPYQEIQSSPELVDEQQLAAHEDLMEEEESDVEQRQVAMSLPVVDESDLVAVDDLSSKQLQALWRDTWALSQRQFCIEHDLNTGGFSQWLGGKVRSRVNMRAVRLYLHTQYAKGVPKRLVEPDPIAEAEKSRLLREAAELTESIGLFEDKEFLCGKRPRSGDLTPVARKVPRTNLHSSPSGCPNGSKGAKEDVEEGSEEEEVYDGFAVLGGIVRVVRNLPVAEWTSMLMAEDRRSLNVTHYYQFIFRKNVLEVLADLQSHCSIACAGTLQMLPQADLPTFQQYIHFQVWIQQWMADNKQVFSWYANKNAEGYEQQEEEQMAYSKEIVTRLGRLSWVLAGECETSGDATTNPAPVFCAMARVMTDASEVVLDGVPVMREMVAFCREHRVRFDMIEAAPVDTPGEAPKDPNDFISWMRDWVRSCEEERGRVKDCYARADPKEKVLLMPALVFVHGAERLLREAKSIVVENKKQDAGEEAAPGEAKGVVQNGMPRTGGKGGEGSASDDGANGVQMEGANEDTNGQAAME